jgi:hypothetical protein
VKYDISVFMPSIRTHKLESWYKSLELSCSRHSFEVVIAGPFEIPDSLAHRKNVKFVKTYSHPTKAAQLAAELCEGELVYHTTDDVLFYPSSIDDSIDELYSRNQPHAVMSMRYIEGKGHSNNVTYPPEYWSMKNFCQDCYFMSVPPDWRCNAQFMMRLDTFKYFGGFDCRFEYLTHAAGDLLLRMQAVGCTVYDSPNNVTNADWYEGTSVDHEPIHHAQLSHDVPLFFQTWANENSRRRVDFLNYKNYPDVWDRRFRDAQPQSYDELKLNPPK